MNRNIIFYLALLCFVYLDGCDRMGERFQQIEVGMTAADVEMILGLPDKKTVSVKVACDANQYVLGPKPSKLYCALPDDARVQTWMYEGRDQWGWVVFAVTESGLKMVDFKHMTLKDLRMN